MNLETEKRACVRFIELSGYLTDETHQSRSLTDQADAAVAVLPDLQKFPIWHADTVLTGLRAVERGDMILALRCALQGARYAGQVGAANSYLESAAISLRNALEKFVREALDRNA